jgi:L-2,4-diaminobutyric acid acetyltransferase
MLMHSQSAADQGPGRFTQAEGAGSRNGETGTSAGWVFRSPVPGDGPKVHALIAACPPLDPNSLYCNLLQCSHFAGTCVLAERGGAVLGWVSAYVPPGMPDTLFVWQVAVDARCRGEGLAPKMIRAILGRAGLACLHRIATTITPDNEASWSLFRKLARALEAPLASAPYFLTDLHFGGSHASEHLVSIGPFPAT